MEGQSFTPALMGAPDLIFHNHCAQTTPLKFTCPRKQHSRSWCEHKEAKLPFFTPSLKLYPSFSSPDMLKLQASDEHVLAIASQFTDVHS